MLSDTKDLYFQNVNFMLKIYTNRSDTSVCTDIDGTVRKQLEEDDTGKLNLSFSFRARRFVNAVLISGLDNLTGTPSRGAVGVDSDLPRGSDFTVCHGRLLFVRTV